MKNLFNGKKATILVFIFFICVAVFLTWPLLPNFFKSVYGEAGDPVGAVWSFKWFRETALSGHGGAFHYSHAGYPDGISTNLPLPLLYMPLTLITYLPRGEAIAYNLIILISVALNGFLMFLLGRKLFKNGYAALGMGLIYMFCPYAAARARGHYTLVEISVFPLMLYVSLNLKEEFNRRNKIIFFIALLLALNIHPYYSCMILFMLALLFLYYVARRSRRGDLKNDYRFMRDCILLTLAATFLTGALFYLQFIMMEGGLAAISRREGDLYAYAAHAWNYFVPSTHSAFFGDATRQFMAGKVYTASIEEYTLYLGYINLGLALVGLLLWITRRFSRMVGSITASVRKSANWVIPFALLLGIASFLFSLQPTFKIGSFTLHMPSWFIYRVFPFLRVYSRFGVLVFFSVTLVSGACLSFLVELLRTRKRLVCSVIFVLLMALVLAEFLEVGNKPMQKLYERKAPYADLKDMPEGTVIVEYPFVASDESYNSLFLWSQIYHGKSILNGYALGTEREAERLTVLDLFNPETPGMLAFMGADYVVVHKDMYEKGSEYTYLPTAVDLSSLPAGFEIIEEDENSALVGVNAGRPDTAVVYDPKCSLAYLPGMNPGLWLQFGREWVIRIDAVEDMTVDIEFNIYSVEGDRDLRIDLGSGRDMTEIIGNSMARIVISEVRLRKGVNSVYLSTEAEEVPCNEVFGGNDLKPVSFVMSFWEIKGTPEASTPR